MTAPSQLRLIPLGSGSSGNCTVVTDGTTTVLVDCGFSASEVTRRLASVGVDAAGIDALLITHEHSDHIRGVDVFCRRRAPSAVVYGSKGTLTAGPFDDLAARTKVLRAGDPVRVGSLDVIAFCTSHDSAQPFGYRIERDGCAIGIATDTGCFTDEVADGLAGCEVIALESNHDVDMLERGPYPPFLKSRILSRDGHLSNADAARALERLASNRLRRVFGMHRSATNNTARLARSALVSRLAEIGLDVEVTIAPQHQPAAG